MKLFKRGKFLATEMYHREIALSLMEAQTSSSSREPQNEAPGDALDEQEQQFQIDLQRAIEASKVEFQEQQAAIQMQKAQATEGDTSTSMGSRTFLSERAQLEKERLARLKRYRGESDDHEDIGDRSQQPPVKRPHLSLVEPIDRRVNQPHPTRSASSTTTSSSTRGNLDSKTTGIHAVPVINQLFWDGELRPTANKHSQPREDGKATFRLSEVLGPVRTQYCILSPIPIIPLRKPTFRLP